MVWIVCVGAWLVGQAAGALRSYVATLRRRKTYAEERCFAPPFAFTYCRDMTNRTCH
jgi:hypothetical protein